MQSSAPSTMCMIFEGLSEGTKVTEMERPARRPERVPSKTMHIVLGAGLD